ncbi:MAG TPA: PIG-L family deacetylase [Thermoanaerobaculia bacterium]|nr:PIG-L family deacetylase [Thermoanaerobaculia bacterium]
MHFVEHELIPFASEPLLGETLLVLAPHPDDEVIGCGGVVAHHAREKRRIHVVVATDGREGADEGSGAAPVREGETDAGLRELGAPPAEFLRIPDRRLAEHGAALRATLRERLLELAPDLVVLPSPIEIHPDHAALARIFIELIQQDLDLAGPLALCRVAFMEISQPIRPNRLVDVTDVAEAKQRAIGRHESQQTVRDYARYARGLNEYRTMTLGPESRFAEAYWLTDPQWIRTHPLSEIENAVRGARIEAAGGTVPITVVVRTRNRPRLLREALASIRNSSADAPIVVVNDGEEPVASALEGFESISLEEKKRPAGRSEAMNRGVRAASTEWIAFLDDDDLFYPEHLPTLGNAAATGDARAFYTDAISAIYLPGEDGTPRSAARLRTYARDFDRDMLLLDNYIPLPTLLVRREDFLSVGGFDRSFDLFEDWDFVIRLSALGPLTRIPRITCEIRHFGGSESAMLGNPAGSPGYREAKLRVWKKHSSLEDTSRVEAVFQRLKETAIEAGSSLHEQIGRARHLERDVTRFEREKELLLAQLAEQAGLASRRQEESEALHAEIARQAGALAEIHADRGRLDLRVRELEAALEGSSRTAAELYREIERLNALLTEIYGTRAWRLHRTVERLRGRR